MIRELSHLLGIAQASIEERGVIRTLQQGPRYLATYLVRRRAWEHLEEADGFDVTYGTDTTIMLGPADFGVDSAQVRHASLYRATRPQTFGRIIQAMNIRHEDYTFIDFGSGKGRTLMLAAELPFKRIIGVELSPKLHEIAQRNVAIYRSTTHRGDNIELVCGDATAYRLPTDNVVFYLFDPFELPVMRAVIENILQSLQKQSHRVLIAYVNPTYCGAMDQSGFLERVSSSRGGPPESHADYAWLIYANQGTQTL